MLTALTILTALAASSPALARTPRASLLSIEADVMCLSCHEPLELAQSPQAQAEKDYIKGLIAKGMTTRQIEANLVQNYGVSVLGKPPASGFNLTVYVLPPALLVLGIALLIYTLPKWRERSRRAAATALPAAPDLSAADSQRLDEDLARFT
jgi:cytochrome c-type biogenesis protein CcmH